MYFTESIESSIDIRLCPSLTRWAFSWKGGSYETWSHIRQSLPHR